MSPSKILPANPGDPLSIILSGRRRQLAFCDELEVIADGLLDRVDPIVCSALLDNLSSSLPLLQKDEEALYEVVLLRTKDEGLLNKWIKRAADEHRRNEDYVLELADPLAGLAAGRDLENLQATGYLFRCAFEAIRHHLAWEEITLFGNALKPVNRAEEALLLAKLAKNRKMRASTLRLIH